MGDIDVHGRVGIHQAHLVLELMVNPIKQVADAATDNVDHRELPRMSEECVSRHCLARVCNSELQKQMPFEVRQVPLGIA